tara:strand:+ start:626 stop:1072 length:447 start_codon:yes stop_codon:yes gene_type:complete
MEKTHQILFQKLWVNYSLKQYKVDRIKRYEKRIKINKLEKFIKNKKVVDFGCGHGNFIITCNKFNPISCLGIDSIKYAKSIVEKLNLSKYKFNFKVSSVYKTKIKSGTYDFAIQNGGFSTDIDKPFYNDKYFQKKFGFGDLRILCQKA